MITCGLLPFIAVFFLVVTPPGPAVAVIVASPEGMALARYVPIATSIVLIVPLILGSYAVAPARARKSLASECALRRSNRHGRGDRGHCRGNGGAIDA